MKITVETGKWAERYVSGKVVVIELPEGSVTADVAKALNIPLEEAGLAVLNGKAVSKSHVFSDGDTITLHPIIVGG